VYQAICADLPVTWSTASGPGRRAGRDPGYRESHGIRPVEGIGCARFRVAGKGRAACCRLGRRDRIALTGSGPVRRPLPGENRNRRRGRRLARETAGLSAVVRVAGGAPAPWYRPEQKTAGAGHPGHAEQQGRRRPAVLRGPGRPPAPLTAAATFPVLVSRSRAPDGSGARQGGPVISPARDGNR
jgi:hypothetical protein